MDEQRLYRVEGILSPETTGSHLEFRLFLDREYPELRVEFRYSPKRVEDTERVAALVEEGRRRYGGTSFGPHAPVLQNLLTLSFDDARGFRGAAHRHPPEQVLILGPHPSPGLVAGPVPRGPFRITLSVHAVLTEACTYHLTLAPESP